MLRLNLHLKRADFQLALQLELPSHGLCAIFGHSGAGKSTLLRSIAGLDYGKSNQISFNDLVWQDETNFLAPYLRKIGYIFQEHNLFNHLNVLQNLEFAQKRSAIKSSQVQQIIYDFELVPLLKRRVNQLSGGEKQVVALARALITQPQLLLLDEAFAAVDIWKTRYLLEYLANLNLPVIYVTHVQEEVLYSANYVVHLERGCVLANGEINQVLANLGYSGLVINATKLASSSLNGDYHYQSELGLLVVPAWCKATNKIRILIESEFINWTVATNQIALINAENKISAMLIAILPLTAQYVYLELKLSNDQLIKIPSLLSNSYELKPGVELMLNLTKLKIL